VRWDAANTLPYVPDGSDTADLELDDEDDADAMPRSIVVDAGFDWEGDARRATLGTRRSSTRRTCAASRCVTPRCARTCAAPYAGLASDEALGHLKRLGVTAVELLPIHHIVDESFLHERGLLELLGLQLDRLPRAVRAVLGQRHARRAAARVQGHGQGAAPRGHRGDPRRRLQPHGRGQPPRPDARFKGVDNASYYRLMPDDRATTWTSRARATRSTSSTRASCG
jgi:glycogen operon protein